MLRAIAIYLGIDPEFFERSSREGNSVLRLLHYPPVDEMAPGIRAEAHGDINLITMLLGAEEGGLEIIDKSGDWIPVAPPPGALAVNVGDMLERQTNGRQNGAMGDGLAHGLYFGRAQDHRARDDVP